MTTTHNIECPVGQWARECGDALALTSSSRRLTYADLDGLVEEVEDHLRRHSVRAGDRVALLLDPGIAYVAHLWALFRLGSTACPMSLRLPPEALHKRLEAIGASALISSGRAPVSGLPCRSIDSGPDAGTRSRSSAAARQLDLRTEATIVFTSGTTGEAKGVVLTLGNHHHNAGGANQNMPLSEGDVWMQSLPLYHVGGLAILFRCFIAGATVHVPSAAPFEASSFAGEIERGRVTHLSLVHTQLRRLVELPDAGRNLKAVLVGGSPIPDDLLHRAADAGWPVCTTYGLTEMASQVTATAPGEGLMEWTTAGRVLPRRELRVKRGGRIAVRGETLFVGYATEGGIARPLDEEGWFQTSDLGTLDAEGRLRVIGRMDNAFQSGGENVQPEEVERAIRKVYRPTRLAVVPVESAEYGRRPVAVIDPLPERDAGAQLLDRLRDTLEAFKVPVAVLPWPDDDDSKGVSKVDRQRLIAFANRALRGRF